MRWAFCRLLDSYSEYVTFRENVKYRLVEGYFLLRQAFMKIGSELVAGGLLDKPEDIFFLSAPEVVARDNPVGRKRELIRARREQHALWESTAVPDLIMGDDFETPAYCCSDLTGIGCSPGIGEGNARVLLDVSEAGLLQPGEILVSPHTDPGWTPLFLTCRALVTEIGGFLSHGATVAREYGIPAVVNVREATKRIRTGDFIRVDGTRGRITICRR
jgi:phosphohistidine swiveling domain-containing protein